MHYKNPPTLVPISARSAQCTARNVRYYIREKISHLILVIFCVSNKELNKKKLSLHNCCWWTRKLSAGFSLPIFLLLLLSVPRTRLYQKIVAAYSRPHRPPHTLLYADSRLVWSGWKWIGLLSPQHLSISMPCGWPGCVWQAKMSSRTSRSAQTTARQLCDAVLGETAQHDRSVNYTSIRLAHTGPVYRSTESYITDARSRPIVWSTELLLMCRTSAITHTHRKTQTTHRHI